MPVSSDSGLPLSCSRLSRELVLVTWWGGDTLSLLLLVTWWGGDTLSLVTLVTDIMVTGGGALVTLLRCGAARDNGGVSGGAVERDILGDW